MWLGSRTTLPPAPPAPASLGSTYVEPLVVEAGQVLHAESEPQLKLTGPNYFREEDIEEDMENRKIGNFKEIVKKPGMIFLNHIFFRAGTGI